MCWVTVLRGQRAVSEVDAGDIWSTLFGLLTDVSLEMDSLPWNVWHAPIDDASFTLSPIFCLLPWLYFPFRLIMSDRPLADPLMCVGMNLRCLQHC